MSEIGARLRGLFEEIAPPLDMGRVMATDGDRPRARRGWLVAVAAAVVALLVGGGWLLFLRGSLQPVDIATPPVVTATGGTMAATEVDATSTSLADLLLRELRPVRVDCTSELPSFHCVALIDDDPDNSWNAEAGGVGTSITFLFSPPVQIAEVILCNLEDTERFMRNARIKGIEILIDDLPQSTIAELEDSNEPQRVQLRSLRTSSVTITITSAYPGQTYEGREPFYELALQEIEFWGRISPDPGAEVTTTSEGTVTTSVATEPLPGEWSESSLPCCGPSGYIRDLLWDGAQFLALARHPGDASVWRSEDGLTWEEVAYLGDFTTLDGPGSLDHGPRGYLAGGSVGDDATVWYSADGADWTQVTLGPGGVGDVAVTAESLVAVGSSGAPAATDGTGGRATVWVSGDGLAWEAADLGSAPDNSGFNDVALVVGEQAVALGSSFDPEVPLNNEWVIAVSSAGAPWTLIEPSGLTAQQFDAAAAAMGYLAAIEGPAELLWTSPNGEVWESEALGGLTTRRAGFFYPATVAAMLDLLVVAGGENYIPDGEVFNRSDPVVWLQEPNGTWRWAVGAPALDSPGGIVYLAAAGPDRVVLVLDHADDRLLIWVFRPAD